MDISEVILAIEKITNDARDNHLDPFLDGLNDITPISGSLLQDEVNQGGNLRELHGDIELSLQIEIDQAHQIIQSHIEEVQRKQAEVERLELIKKQLKVECETAAIKKEKLTRRLENIEQKHTDLQKLKDYIKTYKVLTGTNFGYKKGNRIGYTKASNSLNYDVFDFKMSEMNQQDATRKLWALLGDVSTEDSRNRTEYINNNNKKIILD